MAIVKGLNFIKMYETEPKELGGSGLQHTKHRIIADVVSGADGDEYVIGELPEKAILLRAYVPAVPAASASAIEVLQDNGSYGAAPLGEVLSFPRGNVKVTITGAALTDALIVLEYLQC